jgi:hypothetical protein
MSTYNVRPCGIMSLLPLEYNIPIQRYFPPLTSRARFSPERLLVHPGHTLRRVYVVIEDPMHQFSSEAAAAVHTAASTRRAPVSASKPSPPVSAVSSTVNTESSAASLTKRRVSKPYPMRQPPTNTSELKGVSALPSSLIVGQVL